MFNALTDTQIRPGADGGRHLALALKKHQHQVSLGLMGSIAEWSKYADEIRGYADDPTDFLKREIHAFIDYLALYFRSGDSTYRNLYIGEKLKQLYEPDQTPEQQQDRKGAVTQTDENALLRVLKGKVSGAELALFERELKEIHSVITTQGRHTLNALLIGDCVFLDIISFLTAGCLEDGITLNPTFLTTKNPAELRSSLRGMADRKFDLVFYSPFTYEFSLEYSQLMNWRRGLSTARDIATIVDTAMTETSSTLDVLSDVFECNIFVHNSANVRRHDGTARERLKNLLTLPARARARTLLNARLQQYVTKRNAATFDHLFVLDEIPLLHQHGDAALGRMFYDSDLQHPAALGKWLAEEYRDVIATHALLLKKKLVICDLDNTLWKGVIGEGAVEHYHARQQTLKRLQAKGVVLAISSKNDPKNVRWNGGVLCENDFVCSQINWDSKAINVQRIAQVLNLKPKDFVFIDDRDDEREMVKMAVPQVHTMDATADRTWRLLELWSRFLSAQGETDRTQFYKQREQRESFISAQQAAEDQAKLFEQLGITVNIREAKQSDFKRVAELINRTNQFNLCGSRTSVREITAWGASGEKRILLADAADKFGNMGTVSILIMRTLPDRIEIPIFVLSCRVFGYGIEDALINVVKRLAARDGASPPPIVGLYKETPSNEPCRKVYPNNGFSWNGAVWTYAGNGPIQDPRWLSIKSEEVDLAATV